MSVSRCHNKEEELCTCVLCKNNKPFTMPKQIIDAVCNGNLVIFAGAGVSTESKPTFPFTLYEEVMLELGIKKDTCQLSFPDLMSEFCRQPDGRRKLLKMVRARFEYVESFPEIYGWATRFHRELSTIHHVNDIVTTNWDDYFERECGAVPIVSPADFAFWDMPGRKVYKIHGSVNNYGSIVATNEDYKECYKMLKSGIVGSNLKMLLATKTIVFIGYSFGDFDFNQVYALLKKEMKDVLPHSYVVTISEESAERFEKMKLTPIVTDGTFFISTLKKHLVESNLMMDDNRFEGVKELLSLANRIHILDKYDVRKNPAIIYTSFYLDGLIHAFERMELRKKTGEYSCFGCAIKKIDSYWDIRRDKLRNKAYGDVAYIDGYIAGLSYLLRDDEERERFPLFYVFGYKYEIDTPEEFEEVIKNASKLHKSAYKFAEKMANRIDSSTDWHHTAFLL